MTNREFMNMVYDGEITDDMTIKINEGRESGELILNGEKWNESYRLEVYGGQIDIYCFDSDLDEYDGMSTIELIAVVVVDKKA